MMSLWRSTGCAVVSGLLLALAPSSGQATINLTGHWNLKGDFFGTIFFESWNITQAGTSLMQSPPSDHAARRS